jgi:hypothetical protein
MSIFCWHQLFALSYDNAFVVERAVLEVAVSA